LNERVDIKGYLQDLVADLSQDPYSFIPYGMRPENASLVGEADVTYDFTTFNNVNNIIYGGYGEQWHMVIENINQSEEFYKVTTLGSEIITAANTLVYAFLDDYYDGTVSHTFASDARFTAKLDFNGSNLTYSIQFISGVSIPLFGSVTPQIDMEYAIGSHEKTFRIQLGENNALKFVSTPDSYTFALEYGIETVSRKAYFTISKDEDDKVEGHLYEYVQYKDKDLVPACADFYIDEDYASVVGNKASGMPGFTGYINELYLTEQGKLLGYEVRETFTKWGISATYHTLWFNLNNITGINSIKAIATGEVSTGLGADNPHEIYLDGSGSVFEPAYNKKALIKTSRKYDIEMRKQYFYGYKSSVLSEYEVELPMMFIQADHDGYTNFTDFHDDMEDVSGISDANVTLASAYLNKIQYDYSILIDIFEAHKGDIDTAAIVSYIGDAKNLN
jgi:hypothetical protein